VADRNGSVEPAEMVVQSWSKQGMNNTSHKQKHIIQIAKEAQHG
jgi:hypothetical protein